MKTTPATIMTPMAQPGSIGRAGTTMAPVLPGVGNVVTAPGTEEKWNL